MRRSSSANMYRPTLVLITYLHSLASYCIFLLFWKPVSLQFQCKMKWARKLFKIAIYLIDYLVDSLSRGKTDFVSPIKLNSFWALCEFRNAVHPNPKVSRQSSQRSDFCKKKGRIMVWWGKGYKAIVTFCCLNFVNLLVLRF